MTFKYTADIPDRFFDELNSEGPRQGFKPLELMCVMYSESGLYAHAQNPAGHATGILQFMPFILKGMGWEQGDEAFRHLDAAQQLPFVFSYFVPWAKAGKTVDDDGVIGWHGVQRIYQATFLPGTLALGSTPDYAIAQQGGQLSWAYAANPAFDTNRDGKITLKELGQAITRNCRGKRWEEAVARLTGNADYIAPIDTADLGTIAGMQAALTVVGFDPGPVDGANGPKTKTALVAFQQAHTGDDSKYGLKVDGVYGPATRAALNAEYKAKSPAAPTVPDVSPDTDKPRRSKSNA